MSPLSRFRSWAPHILGITRILTGVMFASHGAQKVLGVFGGMPAGAPKLVVWTAGPIEFVGGILIALGLFTRTTAFICSGLMAAAYFMGHASGGFWPKVNGGEPAILYCWIFLYIAAAGPGAFALDNLWRRRAAPASGELQPAAS
jgi:putative oxidoreductase